MGREHREQTWGKAEVGGETHQRAAEDHGWETATKVTKKRGKNLNLCLIFGWFVQFDIDFKLFSQ